MSRRATLFPRTAARRCKWLISPTMAGTYIFNQRSVGVAMGSFASRDSDAPLLTTTARMFAYFCYHLQIPVRHARARVGPVITSHNDLGAAGGRHHVRRTTCLQGESREVEESARWGSGLCGARRRRHEFPDARRNPCRRSCRRAAANKAAHWVKPLGSLLRRASFAARVGHLPV